MALDPPPPGAVPAQRALDLISDLSWQTAVKSPTSQPYWDVTDTLLGVWDEQRSDIQIVTDVFESVEFQKSRAALVEAAKAGWQESLDLRPGANAFASYGSYRKWAKWLTAHSRWSRVHNEDMDTAIEDWMTTLRLARQMRRQHLMITYLVEAAIVQLVAQEIVLAARETTFPVPSIELTSEIDALMAMPTTPKDIVEGERLYTHYQIDSLFVKDGGDWLDISAFVQSSWSGRSASRIWNLASPLFHGRDEVTQKVEVLFQEIGKQCTDGATCYRILNGPDRSFPGITVLDGFETFYDSSDDFMSIGRFSRYLNIYYSRLTGMEGMLTVVALEDFKHKTGLYPEALNELLPDYLSRMPIDYTDRQHLRYQLTAEGYLLYSIGPDGRDNGGRGKDFWRTKVDDKGDRLFGYATRKDRSPND